METLINEFGYLALIIGTFFEGETAILTASSLIYHGTFSFFWTVLAAFSGSFVSDWVYYLIGRINGNVFIAKHPKLQKKIAPVTHFFHRHKLQILFSYRFLYGFRIIIPLVIGMSGLKPMRFLFYSIVTGLLWASTVSLAGYWAGRWFNLDVNSFENNIGYIVIGFASLGLIMGYTINRLTTQSIRLDSQK